MRTIAGAALLALAGAAPDEALLVVCFADAAVSTRRHSLASHGRGCQVTVGSFRMANADALVRVITPSREMVDPVLRRASARDARLDVFEVGAGPYGGVELRGADGRFRGNCLRHVWYAACLRALPPSVARVLVADGSDVFFQRDPFELLRRYAAASLLFFGDRGDDPDEGRRYFRRRMLECPGLDAPLERVEEAFGGVYANGGVFLGARGAAADLVGRVAAYARACGAWESDQGLLNLARYRMLAEAGFDGDRVKAVADRVHSVAMGHYDWPHVDARGALAAAGGEALHVVHQYHTRRARGALQEYYRRVRPWLAEVS